MSDKILVAGNGLPLLAVGAAATRVAKKLEQRGFAMWIERGASVTMIAMGYLLLWRA